MTHHNKVQGDVKDTIVVILSGVEDLTAITSVEAHVWRTGATGATLTAEVTDAIARTVTVQLGGANGWLATASDGVWWREIQGTFADGTILTWPSGDPDTIRVRADA